MIDNVILEDFNDKGWFAAEYDTIDVLSSVRCNRHV